MIQVEIRISVVDYDAAGNPSASTDQTWEFDPDDPVYEKYIRAAILEQYEHSTAWLKARRETNKTPLT